MSWEKKAQLANDIWALLNRRGIMSLAAINEALGQDIHVRTFQRMKPAIESIHGVKIVYNRSKEGYKMELEDSSYMKREVDVAKTFVQMFEGTTLDESRIQFEQAPHDVNKEMEVLLGCLEKTAYVRFKYNHQYHGKISNYEGYVQGLKQYRKRWYLILEKNEFENPKPGLFRTMSLDRITELESINPPHGLSASDFNMRAHFKDNFGIFTNGDALEEVLLEFTVQQAGYVHKMPLHASQEEVATLSKEGYVVFRYEMKVTYDLVMEVLSYGSNVRVLKSDFLIEEIRGHLKQMQEYYLN
jgi:predicted DNA-binding transcriptional regulator YafY